MTFLVINCGTSSVKMTLFSSEEGRLTRQLERHFSLQTSYAEAIHTIIRNFEKEGFASSSLKGVGHRVVHGGEKYVQSTLITPSVENDLQAIVELAPLHNPPALNGIAYAKELFPNVPQVAVFDTAFHSHLPPKAACYPIPLELSRKYKIKRYGFHGIAHAFSWKRYVESYGRGKTRSRVITVHLGSGCSLAAIDSGISVDTTMGFTPLDGLMMATRSGEVDPSIVAFLCDKEKKCPDEIISILNEQSGLLGICGEKEMERVLKRVPSDPQATLALEMFIYHIQKKIGSFIAVLGGVDALIFSGGIGENAPTIRGRIAEAFAWVPVSIENEKNSACIRLEPGDMHCISRDDSKVTVCVVGSDENLFIAEAMVKLLNRV